MTQSTINPFAPRRVFSMSDPALDMTDEQRAEYRRTFDASLIKAHDGKQPVEFEIEPADAVWSAMNLSNGSAESNLIAFRACCRSIKIRGEVLKPSKTDRFGSVEVAGDDWVRKAIQLVGAYRVIEIGIRCVGLSLLGAECVDPLLQAGGAVPPS